MSKEIKRQLKRTMGLILGLFLVFSSVVEASEKTDNLQAEIIKLVNQERQGLGLAELAENPVLDQAAQLKLADMFEEDYFSHTSPAGIDPWHWFSQAGYNYRYAGENLAMDFTSAASVHRAWMKSPTHKENIVSDKFSEIGVAVAEGSLDGRETLLAVQLFGKPNGQAEFLKSSLLEIDKNLIEELEAEKISIKESSVFPWRNSLGENEALVFAEVTGSTKDVSVVIKEKSFPLEKIRENTYLSLVSLEGWSPEKDQAVIKARSLSGWEISELILPTKYYGYFRQERELKKVAAENFLQDEVIAAGQTNVIRNEEFFSLKKIQDGALVFGVLVFLLTIGNIWILEKEEERLLLTKCA